MALGACAGAPRPAAIPPPGAAAPWELPAGSFPSQRLFRLHYDGSEGEGALRLVLRLAGPERYRLTIADRLGRPLYAIDAAAAGGLLVDHREHRFCPLTPDLRLAELPLEPVPLVALPAVLLGRLPAAPRPGERPAPGGAELSFRDAEGRRWSAELSAGAPVAWTLWLEGEPAVWWRSAGAESVLSDRRRGLQMSWREVGSEPLAEPLPPPAPPEGYEPGECGSVETDRRSG
ncbi:MAG TPA: hypothetical protein VM599_09200 [Thermoanaerobaculia bacterium]|nr:hypothetical protein [Thermoanaerobaculia bacterium]